MGNGFYDYRFQKEELLTTDWLHPLLIDKIEKLFIYNPFFIEFWHFGEFSLKVLNNKNVTLLLFACLYLLNLGQNWFELDFLFVIIVFSWPKQNVNKNNPTKQFLWLWNENYLNYQLELHTLGIEWILNYAPEKCIFLKVGIH